MCHISYFNKYNKDDFKESLELHIDRGTDAFGYLGKGIVDKYDTQMTVQSYFPGECADRVKIQEGNWICAHTRKTSMGIKTVSNAHPYVFNNIVFMQNGTDDKFHHRAEIMYQNLYNKSHSDTYYLAHYILLKVKMGYSYEKALTELVEGPLKLGAVFLYDKVTDTMYFATDGARDSYVDYYLQKGKYFITEISSYGFYQNREYEKYEKKKYNNSCVIAFKPETGEVINTDDVDFENLNTEVGVIFTKPPQPVIRHTSTRTSSYTKSERFNRGEYFQIIRLLTNDLLTKKTIGHLYTTYDHQKCIDALFLLLQLIVKQEEEVFKEMYSCLYGDDDMLDIYMNICMEGKDSQEIEGKLLELFLA